MRIGFDAKRALHNFRGLGNYSRNLIQGLAQYFPDNEYFLYSPPAKDDRAKQWLKQVKGITVCEPGRYARAVPALWRNNLIKSDLKRDKIGIYHGLSHELPRGIEKTPVKSVVTIHDLLFLRFPQFYKAIDRKIYESKVVHACTAADRIVAVSEQTKRDLVEFLQVPPGKIDVVYQSCDARFFEPVSERQLQEIKARYHLPKEFVFYVGALTQSKNLLTLLDAFTKLRPHTDIHLVLAGTGPLREAILERAERAGVSGRVQLLGFVPTEDLPAVYRASQVFVYPSFFEGFGIPIIEALACGVPVITSKDSCFAEAGGNGATYVDPENGDELAATIERVLFDAQLRGDLVTFGAQHVQQFQSATVASAMMRVYKGLIRG